MVEWKTHQFEKLAPSRRAGSSPAPDTNPRARGPLGPLARSPTQSIEKSKDSPEDFSHNLLGVA